MGIYSWRNGYRHPLL